MHVGRQTQLKNTRPGIAAGNFKCALTQDHNVGVVPQILGITESKELRKARSDTAAGMMCQISPQM